MYATQVMNSGFTWCKTCADWIENQLTRGCQKTVDVVARVWDGTKKGPVLIYSITRSSLGNAISRTYFLPLYNPKYEPQLRIERRFAQNFWDPKADQCPLFPDHQSIKQNFKVEDLQLSLDLNERKLQVTYRMIESTFGNQQELAFNFAFFPGNCSMLKADAVGSYPFLSSYVALKDQRVPVGRFFIISIYDMYEMKEDRQSFTPYYPLDLDDAGHVFFETLRKLQIQHGRMDQVFAHSLGSILFGSALDYLTNSNDQQLLPQRIHFHCAPTSLYAASQKIWYGKMFTPIVNFAGWGFDLEKNVQAFCKKYDNLPFSVSGVCHDHLFPKKAGLSSSPTIIKLSDTRRVTRLEFNLPIQTLHESAHHSIPWHYLYGCFVRSGPSNFINANEHLGQAVIRNSLEYRDRLKNCPEDLKKMS